MDGFINLLLAVCVIGGIYFFVNAYIERKKDKTGGGTKPQDGQKQR